MGEELYRLEDLEGTQRPQGSPGLLAHSPGEDMRPLVKQCVAVLDDWIEHLNEQPSAKAHVQALTPQTAAERRRSSRYPSNMRGDGGSYVQYRHHRALVTAAQCYDRLRKNESRKVAYQVLAALVASHAARACDIETLARQLKKLADRPK